MEGCAVAFRPLIARCCRCAGALKLEVLRLGGTALAINGTNTVTLRQLAGLPRLRQVPIANPSSSTSYRFEHSRSTHFRWKRCTPHDVSDKGVIMVGLKPEPDLDLHRPGHSITASDADHQCSRNYAVAHNEVSSTDQLPVRSGCGRCTGLARHSAAPRPPGTTLSSRRYSTGPAAGSRTTRTSRTRSRPT